MATAGAGPGWNPANDDFSLPTNSKIGSYTIGDKLGEGSFSITYKVSSDASQEAQAVMKVRGRVRWHKGKGVCVGRAGIHLSSLPGCQVREPMRNQSKE